MVLNQTMTRAKSEVTATATAGVKTSLGVLPEWNLDDLFEGAQSEAFQTTFENAVPDSVAFETRYKGKLAGFAANEPSALAGAIAEFEALEDRLGRLISYSGLLYAGIPAIPPMRNFTAMFRSG